LERHLREIRFIDLVGGTKSEMGHDGYHVSGDPLWETEKVKHLLHGRPKKDKEEKRRLRKAWEQEHYKKAKAEMVRLKEGLASGEITQEEYDAGMSKYSVGWYKTMHETQEIVRQFTVFRTQFCDLFARDPRNKNPLPYEWPTSPSLEAYQYLVCLCTPVHHLAQIADVTSRDTQKNLKTALSTDKDYLNQWLPCEKRQAVASVFNSCCDLINAKVNAMDRTTKRQFDIDWTRYRDAFIMSLTGDSHDVPTFVWLDLVALAWEYEENSEDGTPVEG
jgi:hypothetical protein